MVQIIAVVEPGSHTSVRFRLHTTREINPLKPLALRRRETMS